MASYYLPSVVKIKRGMTPCNTNNFRCIIYILLSLASDQVFGLSTNYIVTGASGYLGREIVSSIFEHDPNEDSSEIICLVRETRVDEEKKYWHSKDCVRVMPYDMLDGGETLERALSFAHSGDDNNNNNNGECCVFHVASGFTPTENHEQMAIDNVKGAEDMIRTVAKFKNNKNRVILTSSMAGVRGGGQKPQNDQYYTEQDWNTVSELGVNWGASYQWSKVESERRAWSLSKDLGVRFTSLNPSFIFGPPSKPETSESFSISLVSKWVSGEGPVQSRLCVDVRDVAKAHVLAALNKNTVGERIIISTEARIPSEILAKELKSVAAEMGIGDPDKIHPDTNFDGGAIKIGEKEVGCADRMAEFLEGFEVRDVKDTIRDMAKVLL